MMNWFQLPPAVLAMLVTFVPRVASVAEFCPTTPFPNVLTSSLDSTITISYKQPPNGTCMTAFGTQKQYTGYIDLPPYTLAPIQQNYSVNTFFWFVEARASPETSPLTIWLSGGPGTSSMFGLFNEVGPCEIVQMSDGSYGTQARMWGWDRSSNLLFIDQPNEVGFSYDTATNASFDLYTGEVYEPPEPPTPSLPSYMYMNGTFGTANSGETTPWQATENTTQIAAVATWHFLQTWLAAFPQYNPATFSNSTSTGSGDPVGIHLFAESYGGHYGPVFADYFEEQNGLIANGSLPSNSTLAITLASLGIMNGLIDDLVQDYYYAAFAYNNTYGIQAITATEEINILSNYTNDCSVQIDTCRAAMAATDPNGYGDTAATNALCKDAQLTCNTLMDSYVASGHYVYDIRQQLPSPDPPAAYQEYLNYGNVLEAIGARVNYTESSAYVQDGFIATGDTIRGGQLDDIAYLLTLGVRVGLVYGDADYICNWLGGEAASLAIAALLQDYPTSTSSTPSTYAAGFPAAGYADVVINSTTVGGAVRQFGNLSFTRIYESGHFIPYFQPEAAFTVFTRIIQGTDISTGDIIDLSDFSSSGPANSTFSVTSVTYSPSPTCWVRAWNQSCDSDDTDAMLASSGTVANGIFFKDATDTSAGLPTSSVPAGVPGHPLGTSTMSDSTALTGVYTATGTPTSKSASPGAVSPPLEMRFDLLGVVVAALVFGAGLICL